MKEETRMQLISNFLEEKELIKQRIKRFEELSGNPAVQEYIKLLYILKNDPYTFEDTDLGTFLTRDGMILEKCSSSFLDDCEHDTLMTNERFNGPVYQAYYCLDCGLTQLVKLNEKREFEKGKNIAHIYSFEKNAEALFETYRWRYLLLLANNSSRKVAKVLSRSSH